MNKKRPKAITITKEQRREMLEKHLLEVHEVVIDQSKMIDELLDALESALDKLRRYDHFKVEVLSVPAWILKSEISLIEQTIKKTKEFRDS